MAFPLDWNNETTHDAIRLAVAYILALPVGLHREQESHSVGVRTFPLVAMASCAYILMANPPGHFSLDAQSRVLQGLLAGIGFIGGGAILKSEVSVHGTATAASIFAFGVVGAAVATDRYWVALVISLLTLFTLRVLWPLKQKLDRKAETKIALTSDEPPAAG